jgi:hypothetical protein
MSKNLYKISLLLFVLILTGCSSEKGTSPMPSSKGEFSIEAKYDYIRSVMGGGGHFIIRLTPTIGFEGEVNLHLNADECLHGRLDKSVLTCDASVAEIIINPDSSSKFGIYQIGIRAVSEDIFETLTLDVEIMQWYNCYPEHALQYLNNFDEWLMKHHAEYSGLSGQDWYCYNTYPQILVVSHWTMLSDDYEVRICHHNTIHPNNWTKFRLRRRGEFKAELAAMRENDSTVIQQMPASEYPTLFGY